MKVKIPYIQLIGFIIAIVALVVGYYFYREDPIITIVSVAIASVALTSIVGLFIQRQEIRKQAILKNRLDMWNSITYRVKKAGESAFNELPIGIVVINNKFEVEWSNKYAKEIFMSPLASVNLKNVNAELYADLKDRKTNFQASIYGNIFDVKFTPEHNVIYFTDITKNVMIEKKYQNRLTTIGYINIDNLEDSLADFDVQERAENLGKIIGVIAKWAEGYGIYVRAFSESRYLVIMDYSQLVAVCDSNFTILDDMKTLNLNNDIARVTLSMGFACDDININELSEIANDQLELALSRGGDQVVVNVKGDVTFFGAKTDAKVKESKVATRLMSEELVSNINKSSNVVIMSHKVVDADGFAASLGIYKIAKALGKDAYIVLDTNSIDLTVEKIYDVIVKEYILLLDAFVTTSEAYHLLNDESLLMVVDTQSEALLVEPKLLKKAKRIGIIDHHRKGIDVVSSNVFHYAQTYASSSVELVVGLFEFLPVEVNLNALEANWMLLGMVVDTNSFIYRTTAKTFAVAAILQSYGAQMQEVKKYLREDISERIVQNDFINNLEIYEGRIGIAASLDNIIYQRDLLAKISDQIISIDGIDAGFAIGFIDKNLIGVSARSLGKVNVQLIMEKLGGGGHLNNAAAQIKGESVEEIIYQLKALIDELINKEEAMKVILTKEVKGRGKKGDVIDISIGYGNHLIRTNLAILATPENLRVLEIEKQKELELEMKHLAEMKELKELIEKTPLKIRVRTGSSGKLFGSVSMKQVVDAFEKETGVALDKRKILYDDNITTLGTHIIPIQLHKDVQAQITLFVIEKV